MAAGEYFVEWKEQYVSKERGNRVVHYFLKDSSGESVLAVVGTERSVRHMFYVVSDEFLRAYGAENSVHAGFRWRSRREVVNWLTSMLSKQHSQNEYARSPRQDPDYTVDVQHTQMREPKGRISKNFGGHPSDIVWSGVSWPCGKQLKHFPAFGRNGITIAVHSFVYVMAEKENRYLAYLEDMYEDRKGQKKVRVRWFHHNREVQITVSLRNPHPKEVFITPYAQVISAECVDGPAIVLTREHYEKCVAVFPNDLLARAHFCYRQFKNHRVKPFKLSKLRGYFDQPIFSCFSPDFFEDDEISSGDEVKVGGKRARSGRENLPTPKKFASDKLKYTLLPRGMEIRKHAEDQYFQSPILNVNDKIELLSLDSGIRGCWFRCTVVVVAKRQIKVRYDDVMFEDTPYNLEEWIPAFKLAGPDKFGMRYPDRPLIRPAVTSDQADALVKVGSPVDAWWCDGWWEGVVTGKDKDKDNNDVFQVYVPSENLFLNLAEEKLRISREWIGDRWVDVEGNPDILSVLSAILSLDCKVSASSAEVKSDGSPISGTKLSVHHENQEPISSITDRQQDLPSAIPDPQQELHSATADPQQKLHSATADPQQELHSATADPQQELPRATADPQQELPCATADPQQELPRATADPQQELPRATADPQQELPPANTVTQQVDDYDMSQMYTALSELESSKKADGKLAVESLETVGQECEAEVVESLETAGQQCVEEVIESLEIAGQQSEAEAGVSPETVRQQSEAEVAASIETVGQQCEAAVAESLETLEQQSKAKVASGLESPGKQSKAEVGASLESPGQQSKAEVAVSLESLGQQSKAEVAESLETAGQQSEVEVSVILETAWQQCVEEAVESLETVVEQCVAEVESVETVRQKCEVEVVESLENVEQQSEAEVIESLETLGKQPEAEAMDMTA